MGLRSVAVKSIRGTPSGGQRAEFGFMLPARGPLARAEVVTRLARLADDLGYGYVLTSDHVVLPTRSSAPYPYNPTGQFPGGAHQDYLEPLVTMSWLLSATKRIKVGVSVLVVPYRNPVVTAKQLATLDAMSGGRVIVGIGVGWWPEEFQALAAPPFAERGAVTDEYVDLMKALWTQDVPRFEGKYYRFADATMLPKPVQKPHPPIWVGGHTDRAIRRTAERGDVWHPIGLRGGVGLAPAELGEKIRVLRERTERAGRSPDATGIAFRAPLDLWPARSRAAPASAPAPLSGPPAKVIADIRAYQAVGVRTFCFDFPRQEPAAMAELMRRFAREVRPKVTRIPGPPRARAGARR